MFTYVNCSERQSQPAEAYEAYVRDIHGFVEIREAYEAWKTVWIRLGKSAQLYSFIKHFIYSV